jgi:prepilin-type N-terminal cleavage/methylation domain-containing protein
MWIKAGGKRISMRKNQKSKIKNQNPKTNCHLPKAGFSLMELMVVVAIMAILIIASMPVFRDFARSRNIKEAANSVVLALRTARGYAITKRTECEVRILTRALYIYALDKESGNWYLVEKGKDIPEHTIIYNIGDTKTEESTCVLPFTFEPLGSLKTNYGSIHIFKDEDLDKTLDEFANYPEAGSIPPNPTDEQRRWCYTITVTNITGKITVYDYGKNNPWPNVEM